MWIAVKHQIHSKHLPVTSSVALNYVQSSNNRKQILVSSFTSFTSFLHYFFVFSLLLGMFFRIVWYLIWHKWAIKQKLLQSHFSYGVPLKLLFICCHWIDRAWFRTCQWISAAGDGVWNLISAFNSDKEKEALSLASIAQETLSHHNGTLRLQLLLCCTKCQDGEENSLFVGLNQAQTVQVGVLVEQQQDNSSGTLLIKN